MRNNPQTDKTRYIYKDTKWLKLRTNYYDLKEKPDWLVLRQVSKYLRLVAGTVLVLVHLRQEDHMTKYAPPYYVVPLDNYQ